MKNSQRLLKEIKSRKIIQKSRLRFTLKNILFWFLFFVFVVIGALSFSIIVFSFTYTDFDLFFHKMNTNIIFIFTYLPIFWIVSTVISLFISVLGMRYTKTGYKHSFLLVVIGNICLSLLMGTIFFFTGGAEKMEQKFADSVSIYDSIDERKIALWSMPEQGFLAGKIIQKDTKMIIEDFSGKKWEIKFNDALIRGNTHLIEGEKIKIIGKNSGRNIFIAEEIRPWTGKDVHNNKRE